MPVFFRCSARQSNPVADLAGVRVSGENRISAARRRAYSALILAARIIFPHFAVSSAMDLPKSAGEPGITSALSSANRALILGSERPALISLLSLAMISAGVLRGAPKP